MRRNFFRAFKTYRKKNINKKPRKTSPPQKLKAKRKILNNKKRKKKLGRKMKKKSFTRLTITVKRTVK